MCSTLQSQQALFRLESFIAHNLTRLGRDKFIYGLLINHQSLGGLLCEYLSVQTAHIKQFNRLQILLPSHAAWPLLCLSAARLEFTLVKSNNG